MSLSDLLAPLDYPRQALYGLGRGVYKGLSGEGTMDDLIGALPGIAGLGAAPLGPLAMALVGGLAQGAGKMTGMKAYDAPSTQDLLEGIGADKDNPWLNMGTQLLTDPLTYAGGGAAAGAFRKVGLGSAKGLEFGSIAPEIAEATGQGRLSQALGLGAAERGLPQTFEEAHAAAEAQAAARRRKKRQRECPIGSCLPSLPPGKALATPSLCLGIFP